MLQTNLGVLVVCVAIGGASNAGAEPYYRGEAIVTSTSADCAQLAYPVSVGDDFELYFRPTLGGAVSIMVFTRDLGSFRLGRLGNFSGSGDGQADLISRSLLISNDFRELAFENVTVTPQPTDFPPFNKFLRVAGKIPGFFDQTGDGCAVWFRAGVNLIDTP